jgi:hypothetical protein
VTSGSVHGVLTGGEGLAGEEPVLRGLQGLLVMMVGDVLDKQWRSKAGDERWRRLWRCIIVPGEGPVNMGGQGAQEHHWSMGMLLQYSIGPEMGQREVFDGGAARVLTGGDGDPAFCRLGCRRVVGM